ncbi:MAG: four helix bundle protein [Deltaproteobacteria bacterium]|nr:four helix bundle protein [Deltaproteobacteria bacterium]
MDNLEFARKLEERTKKFAIDIIRLSKTLPHGPESTVLRNQLTKSGTSIGANYREANRAKSRADFINKIKICESEASEAQYWLELLVEARYVSMDKIKISNFELITSN